jgi:SpoVK/Ycf46/Vps4 family AAA+-type ATPase
VPRDLHPFLERSDRHSRSLILPHATSHTHTHAQCKHTHTHTQNANTHTHTHMRTHTHTHRHIHTRIHTQLAHNTEGYTGADIGAVVREAGLAALDEDISASQVWGIGQRPRLFMHAHTVHYTNMYIQTMRVRHCYTLAHIPICLHTLTWVRDRTALP